jgi:hypothetical protein
MEKRLFSQILANVWVMGGLEKGPLVKVNGRRGVGFGRLAQFPPDKLQFTRICKLL